MDLKPELRGEQDVCKLLDESIRSRAEDQIGVNRGAPGCMAPPRNARTPKPLKSLLFLFISILGLLGLRLFPSTFAEGWIPTLTLVAALGLVVAALIEVVRAR